MQSANQPKRKYDSTRRKAQAEITRRQILAAAGRLFFSSGYSGTTIEMIAHEAGVALETVYAIFGNKIAILTRLVELSVTSEDKLTPLTQSPRLRGKARLTDPHKLLEAFSNETYASMQSLSPIFMLLRATAPTEPEIAALLDELVKERLQGATLFVNQLAQTGQLRKKLSLEQAAETVWTLSSGEVFHLLTVDRGWKAKEYTRWLAEMLKQALLA